MTASLYQRSVTPTLLCSRSSGAVTPMLRSCKRHTRPGKGDMRAGRQDMISSTTRPYTSVSRKSRPALGRVAGVAVLDQHRADLLLEELQAGGGTRGVRRDGGGCQRQQQRRAEQTLAHAALLRGVGPGSVSYR